MKPLEEVTKLKTAITKMTGRIVVSNDLKYLRTRFADLRTKIAAGEDVKTHAESSHTVVTVSMDDDARDAFFMMVDRLKLGKSGTVRAGLGALARAHGWTELAEALEPAP
jgi:hypothetical protein